MGASCAGHLPGADVLVERELGEPEIVSPMEESVHFIEIEEDTHDARAYGWHSQVTIWEAVLPVAAVVHPAFFDRFIDEAVNGCGDGDGAFDESELVEFDF